MNTGWFVVSGKRLLGALGAAAALAAFFTVITLPACGKARGAKAENVLFITLDTTRADHIGCFGAPDARTPNIDRFAGEAVRFDNCFSTTNSTLPSHASMFTSSYMRDNGIYENTRSLYDMPGLIWRVLKNAGFYTAAFTSGSTLNPSSHIEQGLDEFYFAEHVELPAEATVGSVMEWLSGYKGSRKDGQRLFLWVHLFDPHVTYSPPPPFDGYYTAASAERMDFAPAWKKRGSGRLAEYFSVSKDPQFYRNMYKGEVSYMDGQVGRLLGWLKANGMYDDTLIVMVADHGESLGEHGVYWDHEGLYDVNTHVPLIIKPAGRFRPGARKQLVSSVDLYPTVLEAVGVTAGADVSGKSLAGVIADPDAPAVHDVVYYQSPNENWLGVRSLEHTYLRRIVAGVAGMSERNILTDTVGNAELYDNTFDVAQTKDVLSSEPAAAGRFERLAVSFIRDQHDPSTAGVQKDPEQLRKLKSLGYVQ